MLLKKILFLFITILLFTSCGGGKAITGSTTADSAIDAKIIIASHLAAVPKFKTLAARMYVSYEDEKKSQGITVSMRMEKDKKIWIKASILGATIAKALITPEEVSYYETLGNSYFTGNFSLLSDFVGTDINFEQAQSILLGQSIFDLKSQNYTSSIITNKYRLEPKKQNRDFFISLLLNPDTFKISQENLSQPKENRSFSVNYSDYQLIESQVFPTLIYIDAKDGEEASKIEITYRKIDLNPNINFSFEIPEGYEKIELK